MLHQLSCTSRKSISSGRFRYGVKSASGSVSFLVHPLPRYQANRFFESPRYLYSQSSHLGSLRIAVMCPALPGQRPWILAPGLPPLYQELHLSVSTVLAKKASENSVKSSAAFEDGVIDLMPSRD